jgi:hypothetical protein
VTSPTHQTPFRRFLRAAGRALMHETRRSAGIRPPRPASQRSAEALEQIANAETARLWLDRR